jgi:hypothetical protein
LPFIKSQRGRQGRSKKSARLLKKRILCVSIFYKNANFACLSIDKTPTLRYNEYGGVKMTLQELREEKGLSQKQAAALAGIPLRTYQNYEYRAESRDRFKKEQIVKILTEYQPYTETKGILPLPIIAKGIESVCKKHEVRYVYLFGSYAKKRATEKSDVDLLISCEEKGLQFVGLAEELSNTLHKKVDLLRLDDLENNFTFLDEILKSGVRIYG